jgi:hypothetical protein
MVRLHKGDAQVVAEALALIGAFHGNANSTAAYELIRTWTPPGISVDRDKISPERMRLLVLARVNGIIAAITEQSEAADDREP